MYINPIKVLNLSGMKNLIPTNTEEEVRNTTEALEKMKNFLLSIRVDRKHSRSEAIWLPEKCLAKVTRHVGKNLSNFGFTQRGESFLQPHECLYLLETNYLELLWNGVPFSIEQGYNVLIQSKSDLDKYRIFKRFAITGYKIKEPEVTEKPCIECKRIKIDTKDSELDLLSKFKESGPQTVSMDEDYSTLFNVNLPNNPIKNNESDFEIIKKPNGNEFLDKCISKGESSTITALSEIGSVSFYQFHEVDLDIN